MKLSKVSVTCSFNPLDLMNTAIYQRERPVLQGEKQDSGITSNMDDQSLRN